MEIDVYDAAMLLDLIEFNDGGPWSRANKDWIKKMTNRINREFPEIEEADNVRMDKNAEAHAR